MESDIYRQAIRAKPRMQGGDTQPGPGEKRHRCRRVIGDQLEVLQLCRLFHDPTHGQPTDPFPAGIAGKTEKPADHRPHHVLTAAPLSGLGQLAAIENAVPIIALFRQSLQHKVGLSVTKQRKCQGKAFEGRCLNTFRQTAMAATLWTAQPASPGKGGHRRIKHCIHFENLELQLP